MRSRLLSLVVPDPHRAKTILKLAWPIMAAMLTQTFINQFDTILVGYLPKEYSIAGQAGLGYSVLLHWLIGGFVGAISVGTQALTARRLGEGDREGAGRVLFNSAFLAFAAGSVVTVLAVVFTRPLFQILTSNEQVLAQGVPYCRARFVGILAMVATLSFKSFFDGIGKTHYHLITAIIMNLTNAGLALVLVFGAGPVPRMNVLGAGVAATIASYVGLFIMAGWALRAKYRREFRAFHWHNLSGHVMGRIARLSVPSGVATVVLMVGILFAYHWVSLLDQQSGAEGVRTSLATLRLDWLRAVAPFGADKDAFRSIVSSQAPVNAAATKVIFDILFLSIMACMGLGIATATLVSQNMGRGHPDEAEKFAWTSVRMAALFTGALGILMAVFPDQAMGIFSHDEEVLEVGRMPMRVVGAFGFSVGFGLVLAQSLFGAGANRFVMWVEIVLHFLCLVPLSWFLALPMGLGLTGIFIAAVVYIAGLALMMTWKFKSGTWKKIRI
jgi:multidrug resistance protein, MATE family